MSVIERERVEETTREVTGADVLERAADLLEEFGWCQGAYGLTALGSSMFPGKELHGAVSMCQRGARWRAAWELGVDTNTTCALMLETDKQDNDLCSPQWNDTPGRTKKEVVAKLRGAAAKARA